MQKSKDKSMEKSTAIVNPDSQPTTHSSGHKAVRKARVPLSCEPCRYRKLKCNRLQPCQNCIVRKDIGACVFMSPQNRATSAIAQVHAEDMQLRIDRLEYLVKSLTSQHNLPAHGSAPSTLPAISSGVINSDTKTGGQGLMKVDDNHSVYIGSTHWSDVLHELNQLKASWSQVQEEQDAMSLSTSFASVAIDGPSLLYGLVKPIGFSELLATVPAKPAVDKLIARFFDENDYLVPSLYILHKPAFMEQYEDYWHCPSESKLMWLGLLFAILSITMLSYGQFKDEPPEYEGISQSLSELYRLRTAQCLMMADITKCLPHTLETLMYNSIAEGACKKVSPTGVWIMGGVIIRVAIQMGYHRDPSHFSNISVFQGEMRRRVWHVILSSEATSSFVVGLPIMTHALDHDTAEPRNIHDWELYEGMQELPPSRPFSEETAVSYLITKSRLLRPLGAVVNYASSLQPDSYEVALQIDEQLTRGYLQIPPHLQTGNLVKSANDSPAVVSRRVQLEFLYHQGVCVLHRRFLVQGRFDSRFARSREQCINSAMALLNHQAILYETAKRTDSVMATYWFRVTPISQDFVLPAVILCLDLWYKSKGLADGSKSMSWNESIRDEPTIEALEGAYRIWREVRDISPETRKVYRVLSPLLEVLNFDKSNDALLAQKLSPPSAISDQDFAAHTNPSSSDRDYGTSFNEMDIDWVALDSFLEGSSFEDAYGTMQFNEEI